MPNHANFFANQIGDRHIENRFRLLILILSILLFFTINESRAQSVGDFRSNAATMNWDAAASWQTWNGSTWVTASSYPAQNAGTGTVTIQSGHNVALNVSPANAFNNLLVQGTSATLTINSNQTLLTTYIVISTSGRIVWTGNFSLNLPTNSVLDVVSLGALGTSPCNANQKIFIGSVKYATCSGGSGDYSFADINGAGGSIKVTAASNSPICQGGTVNLTALASGLGAGTATYSWSGSGPSSYTYSSSTQNPVISGLAPGTYSFTATASNGVYTNSQTISVVVTPTVGSPVTPSPSASTICQGSSSTIYTTSATNATSYTWSISGAGNSISGTGTTGTVTWSSSFTGVATISVVANGCNGPSSSSSTTVTVTPSVGTPVFALGSSSTRCSEAGTVTYTASASNNTGITYSLDATALAFTGNSINTATGEVTYASGWVGTSTVTASASGCNGPNASSHTVTTVASLGTVSSPTGTLSICQGSSPLDYTATASNALNYTWSITGTGNSISGTSTIGTITWSPSFTGNATVSVTANGCGGATSSADATIAVNVMPTSSISAASNAVSSGDNTDITFTGTPNATVTYKINGGANLTTTIGAGGTSVVNTGALMSDVTYSLVSITNGTCSQILSGSVTVIVSTLPLEWLNFDANPIIGTEGIHNVQLSWVTASEVNTKDFHIEHSSDGLIFKEIGVTIPANQRSIKNHYQIEVIDVNTGTNYYRIKVTDNDGKNSFSPIKSVIVKKRDGNFLIYPNPSTKGSTLKVNTDYSGEYKLSFFDLTGRTIFSAIKSGNVEISNLPLNPAMYIYVIKTPEKDVTGRIFITD